MPDGAPRSVRLSPFEHLPQLTGRTVLRSPRRPVLHRHLLLQPRKQGAELRRARRTVRASHPRMALRQHQDCRADCGCGGGSRRRAAAQRVGRTWAFGCRGRLGRCQSTGHRGRVNGSSLPFHRFIVDRGIARCTGRNMHRFRHSTPDLHDTMFLCSAMTHQLSAFRS